MSNKTLYWVLYWLFTIMMIIGIVVLVMLYSHYKTVNVSEIVVGVIAAVIGWLADIQQNRLHDLGEL